MNEQKLGLGLIIFMPLLIGAALMYAPLVRRRFLMFSVRVAPGWSNSAEAQRIIRGYRIRVGCLSLAAVGLGYWGMNAGAPWMPVSGPLLLTFGAVVAVVAGRRATLPYASKEPIARSASLASTAAPEANPLHFVVPFVILAAAAYWLKEHWDAIPARFPIHWDIAGKPNGWSERTARGVYGPLVLGAFLCVIMIATSLGLSYGSARLEGGKKTVRWQMLRMFRWLGYLMGLMFTLIALAPLYPEYVRPGWLAPAIIAAIAILVIPVIRASSDPEGSEAERTPDEAWKLGLIYYNPADPALMVEKRMGFGYTMNFGHPLSWVLVAATLAIPVVVMIWK